MSFLDILREEGTSSATTYLEFLLDDAKYSEHIFMFFEGHDDPAFYCPHFRRYLKNPETIHIFKCGRKQNVYDTFNKINLRPEKKNITLFFVDKDLSDILNEKYPEYTSIYVTDYYSIENYVVNKEMLLITINDIFRFDYQSQRIDYDVLSNIFHKSLLYFHDQMTIITIWSIYAIKNGFSPHINNINLSKIFVFNEGLELKKIDNSLILEDYLKSTCKVDNIIIEPTNINDIALHLSKFDPKVYIKGKYELWFLVKFINKLIDILIKTKKLRVRTTINEEAAIEFFGPRLNTPTSLIEFIHDNIPALLSKTIE